MCIFEQEGKEFGNLRTAGYSLEYYDSLGVTSKTLNTKLPLLYGLEPCMAASGCGVYELKGECEV